MKVLKKVGDWWRLVREAILLVVASLLFPIDMLSQASDVISDWAYHRKA